MIFEDQFGKRTYYYYKKKRGRPKKRGPKRKPKKRGCEHQSPWDYKIVLCNFKNQDSVTGYFHTIDEMESAKKELYRENSEIIFPKKYAVKHGENEFIEFESEYVCLEKIRDNSSNITRLRNEYGRLTNHKSSNEGFRIIDKFPHLEEESIWVYGYNPRNDRKDFKWIYDNFVVNPLEDDRFLIIRIYLYYNKVVFRYDVDDINFIICKNKSDAIRFFNTLVEYSKKDRVLNKRIVYSGFVRNGTDIGKYIVNLIKDKTGWTEKKIKKYETL